MRPANAYGEGQSGELGQGFVAAAIHGFLRNSPITIFGEGGTIRDYIHVEDIAAGITAALDHGCIGETYNIGTGTGTSNIEIIEILSAFASESGIERPPVNINMVRTFDVSRNTLDSSELFRVSGWRPRVSLKDGLARCWRYATTNEHQ